MFVQDDWRATSWLTLNLGVRYDVFTPLHRGGRTTSSNIDLTTLKILRRRTERRVGDRRRQDRLLERRTALRLRRDAAARDGAARRLGAVVLPRQLHVAVADEEPAVCRHLRAGHEQRRVGRCVPNLRLSDGLPLPTPTDAANPVRHDHRRRRRTSRTRASQQFNLIVEKEFGGNVFSAGYVGSRGAHVAFVVPNLDLAPAAARRHPAAAHATSRSCPGVTTIGMFASDFESTYNAMQLVFQRRHRNGLTIGSNYVLAHTQWTQPSPQRRQRDRALRRRLRHPPPVRLLGQLRAAVRPVAHRRGEAAARRLAGQRRRLLAERAAVQRHQLDRARQHQRRQRSAEPGRRSGARRTRRSTQWFNVAAFAPQPINTIGNAPRNVAARAAAAAPRPVAVQGLRARRRARSCSCGSSATTSPTRRASRTRRRRSARRASASITSIGNSIPRQMQFAVKLLF